MSLYICIICKLICTSLIQITLDDMSSFFIRRSHYNSMLAKSWHDLCMEEIKSHEMVIDPLKRFSCMKCLFFHFFISFIDEFHVDL